MLRIGSTAPEFTLKDQFGSPTSLSELLKNGDLILYFYPNDFSPVCTAESCAFRDRHEEVATADIQIVGISPQSVSSHRRFANTFGIEFPLLADQRKQVIRAYGVDGPMGFGVRRVTFHIDSSGVVQNRVVSDLMVSSHTDLLRKAVVQHQPA